MEREASLATSITGTIYEMNQEKGETKEGESNS